MMMTKGLVCGAVLLALGGCGGGGRRGVSITSSDTTYRSGKFGFFNDSQEAVRYEFFSISPIQ